MESPTSSLTEYSKQSWKTAWLIPGLLTGALLLACVLVYWPSPPPVKERVNMEKSSGRNGKHANSKAREKAKEALDKVKKEADELDAKINKSPEDKKRLDKLEKKIKHLQKKKDFGGEHHSQKHKGN